MKRIQNLEQCGASGLRGMVSMLLFIARAPSIVDHKLRICEGVGTDVTNERQACPVELSVLQGGQIVSQARDPAGTTVHAVRQRSVQ